MKTGKINKKDESIEPWKDQYILILSSNELQTLILSLSEYKENNPKKRMPKKMLEKIGKNLWGW